MKKALIIFSSSLLLLACHMNDQKAPLSPTEKEKVLKDSTSFTTIEWIDSIHKTIGQVTEGEQVEVTFRFKNTGHNPLIITSVSASCGCTIPETPKEPFAPGSEGVIKAKFNSTGRQGTNHKEVYVTANTSPDNLQKLDFTVDVAAKIKN